MEENTTVVTSKKYSLNWLDGAKGLLMAVLAASLTALETTLESGDMVVNWKRVGIAGVIAGIAYLLKNFFTKAEVKKPIE